MKVNYLSEIFEQNKCYDHLYLRGCANPVIEFKIKKRISAELFIERMAARYILSGSVMINKSDQQIVPAGWKVKDTLH